MSLEGKERLISVQERIAEACRKSGRRQGSVRLVAVTKTIAVEKIQQVYDWGQTEFGENKVQEYLEKTEHLPQEVLWHFIGRLQTNKVKYLIQAASQGRLELLQSLDRVELALEVDKQAAKFQLNRIPCLIQVNSSQESTKAGFAPQEVGPFLETLALNSAITVRGLMTIGPLAGGEEATRKCFRSVYELQESLKLKFPQYSWDVLSMGMSGDFELAIAEGSTLVRVGSAIFGERT